MVDQLDLFVASGKNETNDTTERPREIKVSAPTPFNEQVEETPCEETETEELTTRQQHTYELIVRNSQMGKITTQREIYENYPFDAQYRKDGYIWRDNPKVHDNCTAIWTDINKINANDKVQKIIIPNNFTYKIAESQQEVKDFIKWLYFDQAMAKLWRYSNLKRKALRDGQGRLPFKDKEKEREYFESFIKNPLENIVDQYLNGD